MYLFRLAFCHQTKYKCHRICLMASWRTFHYLSNNRVHFAWFCVFACIHVCVYLCLCVSVGVCIVSSIYIDPIDSSIGHRKQWKNWGKKWLKPIDTKEWDSDCFKKGGSVIKMEAIFIKRTFKREQAKATTRSEKHKKKCPGLLKFSAPCRGKENLSIQEKKNRHTVAQRAS